MRRWLDTYKSCEDKQLTEEGMTDFVKRHRDLQYCANEGKHSKCATCALNKCNGYGTSGMPTIRFTKGYSCPL